MIAEHVRAMRLLLASLLIGALASAPLAVTTGCGGCGIDRLKATVSPALSCLKTNAQRGWGCDDTALVEGDNSCPAAITLSSAGTSLPADLVVPMGASFQFDVIRDDLGAIPQKSFGFTIAGQPGTIEVDW